MTSGLVINVEHEADSRAELFTGDRVSVRSDADADLPSPAALPVSIEIERRKLGGTYSSTFEVKCLGLQMSHSNSLQ